MGTRHGDIEAEIEELVREAVAHATLEARVILTETEVATLRKKVETEVRRQVRRGNGMKREQRRRLKQVREGRLKDASVTTEARVAALGLVPADQLSVVAQPGEVGRRARGR